MTPEQELIQPQPKFYFSETIGDAEIFTYVADRILYMGESAYQKILVFESRTFGKALMLDQAVQFTEWDEFVYHEMLAHVPLLAHPRPQSVVIVGGGDGGAAREVLRHPEVERLELCEIDARVVEVCRRFFPGVSSAYGDPRLHLSVGDGIARVRDLREGSVDVLIVDGTDPNPFAGGLYGAEFYRSIHRALAEDGVFASLAGSPFHLTGWLRQVHEGMRQVFAQVRVYLATVPTYPGFLWAFCVATKGRDPRQPSRPERLERLEGELKYLNRDVYKAAFALPTFVARILSPAQDG